MSPPQRQPHRFVSLRRGPRPSRAGSSRTRTRTSGIRPSARLPHSLPRRPSHELIEPKVAPVDLFFPLRRALDAEGGVLVWDNVVFVFGVERL